MMPADLPGGGAGRTALRRVVLASAIGSALEWYDYFIYGTAAALVSSAWLAGHQRGLQEKGVGRQLQEPGVCWRQDSRPVLDHDFASAAVGRAVPFGIYDQRRDTGFVVVGVSHETAEFATAALRTWWLENGRWCYPHARQWLLEADCGGANGVSATGDGPE